MLLVLCFWLEVEVVVEEGDWLFGQGEGRVFKSRESASEVIPFVINVTDIFQTSLLQSDHSLFEEARHRVGHDFDVSSFHEGWKCGIYRLTCEGHDPSTLDGSYREDM